MDPTSSLDFLGPPRKKMRKGTKSCIECRRRKIRCTFDPGRPNVCNECHSRGSTCVDQEHGTLATNPSSGHRAEQPYSLRERVAQLETVVGDILKKLNQHPATEHVASQALRNSELESEQAAKTSQSLGNNIIALTPTESAVSSPDGRTANAPVLQLFDNYVVSRKEDVPSGHDNAAASKDVSPKAIAVRSALMSLLPPHSDIDKILNGSTTWWSIWHTRFPEICDKCRQGLMTGIRQCEAPMAPAEVAKMLLCISISVEQLPLDFDYAALQVPFHPKEFTNRCIAEIDKLIVNDDDFAATLPGIECLVLLSKYYMNVGRPRKSWQLNRRAIEFAQLTGMHLSTAKPPRAGDNLFERRLKVWCSIVCTDRFLSLLLGLPYAVSDAAFVPQVELGLRMKKPNFETYVLRLGVIMGQMIDRNQDPATMSLPATLKMDQELEEIAKEMPNGWWDPNSCSQCTPEESCDRIIVQFFHNFTRALLHLPFMLKSTTERRYQYCHDTAIESSRSTLISYKLLRSSAGANPYICKIIDFLAFTVAMLLVIHLLGYSEEAPNHSREQDEKDWDLVKGTTEILRKAATESGGTVAAQSANLLGSLCNICPTDPIHMTCKITVPYFGTITVAPGKKFTDRTVQPHILGQCPIPSQSSNGACPNQLSTPPQSNPGDFANDGNNGIGTGSQTTPTTQVGYPDDSWVQLENVVALPNADLDSNGFQGFFDDPSLEMWSNLNLDLDLDQGWNLNWSGDGNVLTTS
ncbi:hypothetical protein VTN00DRAFT_9663 [Thermoascus crustaceus]|uniref:uncharacterized protein n=1 Tax=Thermoascus crustaceus TaxID=5088 RepID=UPI0037423EDA